jgi:hypothetical protein
LTASGGSNIVGVTSKYSGYETTGFIWEISVQHTEETMPEYIQNVSRIPNPGKNFDVTEASVEMIKSLNRGGNVSFTISSPPAIKSRVISALPFESLAEIEAFHDGFVSSDEMRDRFQKLAADCEDVNVAIIRHVRQPSSLPAEPKYIVRTLMVAKRGEAPALLETVLEASEASKTMDPLVSVPAFGNVDVVRVVNPLASLEDANAIAEELQGDAFAGFRRKIASLTLSQMRTLSKVAYVSS